MTGQHRILSYLRSNIVVLVLLNSSNAANYLFQIILGRGLEPAQYGAFNSMASLAVLYGGLVLVVPMLLSRYTAVFSIDAPGRVNTLLRLGLKVTGALALATLAAGLALAGVVTGLLKLDSMTTYAILLVHICLIPMLQVPIGVLQGLSRFTAFGFSSASAGVAYCAGGLVLVWWLGLGVSGAVLSYVLGTALSLCLGLWLLRDKLPASGAALPTGFVSGAGHYTLFVVISMIMVQAMGNLDMVLVRHWCSPEQSGHYATGAVIGRIAFYLPLVLCNVLFPEVARAQAEGRGDRWALATSLGLTALLSFSFAATCLAFPGWIISLLYGQAYVQGQDILRIFGLAMAMLSVANVLFTHSMAHSDFRFLWVLASGLGLFIGLAAWRHSRPEDIANALAGCTCLVLAGTAIQKLLLPSPARRVAGVSGSVIEAGHD